MCLYLHIAKCQTQLNSGGTHPQSNAINRTFCSDRSPRPNIKFATTTLTAFFLLPCINLFAVYVKSQTIVGDSKHGEGVVLAEIIRANIPVRNGVVHLISRPLMIVDTSVEQFLQVKQYIKANKNRIVAFLTMTHHCANSCRHCRRHFRPSVREINNLRLVES